MGRRKTTRTDALSIRELEPPRCGKQVPLTSASGPHPAFPLTSSVGPLSDVTRKQQDQERTLISKVGLLRGGVHTLQWPRAAGCSHESTLSGELVQQRLGVLQVGGVGALGEPEVDWSEEVMGLSAPPLAAPQPRQAHRGAQLK
jgi:hypothetical protein